MTTHCNQGDKPIIKYRFQGDTKDRIFRSRYAPIEVQAKETPVEGSDKYSNEGYKLKFVNPSNPNFVGEYIVLDYQIFEVSNSFFGGDPNTVRYQAAFIFCGEKGHTKNGLPCTGYLPYVNCLRDYNVSTRSPIIDTTVRCPNSSSKRCSIIIEHKGIIVFQDQGNCPATYSVQCGKCSDGQHECESKIYPYYCCNSCADTANKIRNLASQVGKS